MADEPASFVPPRPPDVEPAPDTPPYRAEPLRARDEEVPLYQAERARLREEPPSYQPAPPSPPAGEPANRPAPAPMTRAASPAQAAAPSTPEQGPRLTQAGLPRRVPRANLAPGMAATQASGDQPGPTAGRSPDEVRSMLSSYRTGIERGRTVAGGSESGERPPDAP
jgi:hypothetical protein